MLSVKFSRLDLRAVMVRQGQLSQRTRVDSLLRVSVKDHQAIQQVGRAPFSVRPRCTHPGFPGGRVSKFCMVPELYGDPVDTGHRLRFAQFLRGSVAVVDFFRIQPQLPIAGDLPAVIGRHLLLGEGADLDVHEAVIVHRADACTVKSNQISHLADPPGSQSDIHSGSRAVPRTE